MSESSSPWNERIHAFTDAQSEAARQIQQAGERRRTALRELAQARTDLLVLCEQVAASGLLPKSRIAELADISRSKLYT